MSIVLALCLPAPTRAEEFPLQEYETHVARYLSSLENIAVDITSTSQTLDGSTTFLDESSVISIPGHFRVKTRTRITDKNGRDKSATEWILLRPDGYHVITEKEGSRFLMKRMQKDITSLMLVDERNQLSDLIIPLCGTNYPINQLIGGDLTETHSVRVTNFQRLPEKSGKAFVFRIISASDGKQFESDFELNESWLVTKYTVRSRTSNIQLKREISYSNIGGRVLPSRITTDRIEGAGPSTTPAAVVEFRDYRIYNGSLADFSLAHFGLPEPSSKYQGGSRWYLWFIAAAIVSLGLGWYFRRRLQQRNVTPGTSPAS